MANFIYITQEPEKTLTVFTTWTHKNTRSIVSNIDTYIVYMHSLYIYINFMVNLGFKRFPGEIIVQHTSLITTKRIGCTSVNVHLLAECWSALHSRKLLLLLPLWCWLLLAVGGCWSWLIISILAPALVVAIFYWSFCTISCFLVSVDIGFLPIYNSHIY